MKKILIIEDDPAISNALKEALTAEFYDVTTASDGEEGSRKARKINYDMILLDLMLPLKDGFEVCSELRKEGLSVPIMMLTSKKDEIDKVLGLEMGADDYMTKPFGLKELLARIKAILRRSQVIKIDVEELNFNNVSINFKKQEAFKDRKIVRLSATELRIIKYFLQHEGEVISRNQFLDDVWGYDAFPTTRTVDNYILSIRKKLEDDPANPKHFLTIYSAGYKFQR